MKWDDVTISRKEYDRLRDKARGNDIYVRAGRIMNARLAALDASPGVETARLYRLAGYRQAIRDQREAVIQAMGESDAEEPAMPVTG
jgi:hypothetical protein